MARFHKSHHKAIRGFVTQYRHWRRWRQGLQTMCGVLRRLWAY